MDSASPWGDAYVYDPWANLLQENVTSGTAETLNVAVNTQNQIINSPFTLDADGSLVNDDSNNTYTYDTESRMLAGGTGAGAPSVRASLHPCITNQ